LDPTQLLYLSIVKLYLSNSHYNQLKGGNHKPDNVKKIQDSSRFQHHHYGFWPVPVIQQHVCNLPCGKLRGHFFKIGFLPAQAAKIQQTYKSQKYPSHFYLPKIKMPKGLHLRSTC